MDANIGFDHFLVVARVKLCARWGKDRKSRVAENNTEKVYKVYLFDG